MRVTNTQSMCEVTIVLPNLENRTEDERVKLDRQAKAPHLTHITYKSGLITSTSAHSPTNPRAAILQRPLTSPPSFRFSSLPFSHLLYVANTTALPLTLHLPTPDRVPLDIIHFSPSRSSLH